MSFVLYKVGHFIEADILGSNDQLNFVYLYTIAASTTQFTDKCKQDKILCGIYNSDWIVKHEHCTLNNKMWVKMPGSEYKIFMSAITVTANFDKLCELLSSCEQRKLWLYHNLFFIRASVLLFVFFLKMKHASLFVKTHPRRDVDCWQLWHYTRWTVRFLHLDDDCHVWIIKTPYIK